MATADKITLSVIKADVGGWVGHSTCYPDMLALARDHWCKRRWTGASWWTVRCSTAATTWS